MTTLTKYIVRTNCPDNDEHDKNERTGGFGSTRIEETTASTQEKHLTPNRLGGFLVGVLVALVLFLLPMWLVWVSELVYSH